MKRAKKSFLILATAVAMAFAGPAAQARQVIALLFENGLQPVTFNDDGTISGKLFCQGDVECGTVEFSKVVLVQLDERTYDFDATVTVCQGGACVAAHNSHFLGHSIPQIAPEVPGAVVFQFTIVSHDTIACEDVSGKFASPGCAGKLRLDYRCLAEVDPATNHFVAARGSAYVVSVEE